MDELSTGLGAETGLTLSLSSNEIVANSIFSLLSPPSELCAVCGDIANGFHYGVQTCENCKSCFRRFKVKPPVKKCESGGSCVITPWSRKCVQCKFKKCLEVGMGVKKNSRSRPCAFKTLSQYDKPPASTNSSNSLLSQLAENITKDLESVQEQTTLSKLASLNTSFVSSFLESVKKSVDSCKVCGDIAKHYHSGVRTCRGCSTFFYRYPTRVQTSKCNSGGNCVMTIVKRDCAPCRYQKCLDVGMVHRASPPDDSFFESRIGYQKNGGAKKKEGCSQAVVKADYEQGIQHEESNPSKPSGFLEPAYTRDTSFQMTNCSGFVKMEEEEATTIRLSVVPTQFSVEKSTFEQNSHKSHRVNDNEASTNPSGTSQQDTSLLQSSEILVPKPAEFHVSHGDQNFQHAINYPPAGQFSSANRGSIPPELTNIAWPHQELRVFVPVLKPQQPTVAASDLAETIRNCMQQYGRKDPASQPTNRLSNEQDMEKDEQISAQGQPPSPGPAVKPVLEQNNPKPSIHLPCEVCGGPARFSHCGARACKACAVFFNRQLGRKVSEQCKFTQNCIISADSKSKCTFCRFKKCFTVGMILMNSSSEEYTEAYQKKYKEHMEGEFVGPVQSESMRLKRPRKSPSKGPCEVCGDKSRTGKYGVRTCKTCAEFFARQKLSPPIRKCSEPHPCVIASKMKKCRSCRYRKCLELGMTYNEVDTVQPVTEPSHQVRDPSILLLRELLLFHQRQNSCKACGGKSTGIHHGVLSCDVCEVLFSRVDRDRRVFTCENQGKCTLQKGIPICLSCHYDKCLAVGMVAQNGFVSPEEVQEQLGLASQSGPFADQPALVSNTFCEPSDQQSSSLGSPLETVEQPATISSESADIHEESSEQQSSSPFQPGPLIETADQLAPVPSSPPIVFPNQYLDGMASFLKAYEDNGNYTVGKMEKMVSVEYDWKTNKTSDGVTNRLSAWQHYSKALELDLEVYADLISSLENEVNHLSIDDKFEMFNRNGIKMHILNVTRALSHQGLYLSDGRFIEYPVLDLLYGEELLNDMIDLSQKFLELEFLDEDIALLILLGYYQFFDNPARIENQLNDKKHVAELDEQYKSHIKFVCQRDEVAYEKYQEMVNLIPRIHQIYLKHQNLMEFLNENGEHFEHGTYFRGAYMKTKYQYEEKSDEPR